MFRNFTNTRHRPRLIVALAVGLLLGTLSSVSIHAQAPPKITATGGWNLCVDAAVNTLAQAQALTVTLVEGPTPPITPPGVTWVPGAVGTYTAQIPLSQLPASARTLGVHTVQVSFVSTAGAAVILADGSTLTPSPSAPLNVSYEVVAQPTTPSPTNPRWIKIAGTIAIAAVISLLAAWAAHG